MTLEVDPRSRTLLLDDLVEARKIKSDSIEYITEPISYWEFFSRFLVQNKPCVFGPAVTQDWLCRKEWVTAEGKPDFELLQRSFGDATVPVANCDEEKYSSHIKSDMLFGDYIDYWREYIEKGYPQHMPTRYCKDWHLSRAFPDYKFYATPAYFESDWLNEFWDTSKEGADDYRFVYMGPKGTWTPFHADVLRSYSWSANICGRKKWIFFPPGEEKYLTDRYGQLAYDITASKELEDTWRFPHAADLKQRFEVFQEAGEMVFVPSGWHHQVFNLDDTISINHNWMNGCNIDVCWDHVKSNLEKVKEEIDDCRPLMDLEDKDGGEFSEKCQVILKAASGIDYCEFFNFVHSIACHRMKILRNFRFRNDPDSTPGKTTLDDIDRSSCDELSYCEGCSDCEDQINPGENLHDFSDSEHDFSDSDISDSERETMRILMELEKEDLAEKNKTICGTGRSSDIGDKKPSESSSEVKLVAKDIHTASEKNSDISNNTIEVAMNISTVAMENDLVAKELFLVTKETGMVTKEKLLNMVEDSKASAFVSVVDCDTSDLTAGTSSCHNELNSDTCPPSEMKCDKCETKCDKCETKCDKCETKCDKCEMSCKTIAESQRNSGCSFIQSKSVCQTFGFSSNVNESCYSHFIFDINRTIDVMEDMLLNEDFLGMDGSSLVTDPEQFLWHLKHFVKHYLSIR